MKLTQLAALALAAAITLPSTAQHQPIQPGTIIKIDAERGSVSIKHAGVSNLRLPAGTTEFRYLVPSIVQRVRAGDQIFFRADRYDTTMLVVVSITLSPTAK